MSSSGAEELLYFIPREEDLHLFNLSYLICFSGEGGERGCLSRRESFLPSFLQKRRRRSDVPRQDAKVFWFFFSKKNEPLLV